MVNFAGCNLATQKWVIFFRKIFGNILFSARCLARALTDLLFVQYFHGKVLLCSFVFHQHDPSKRAGAQGF